MSEQTEAIVSSILAAGGFEPMPEPPFKGLLCQEIGGGWWMGGVHATGVYSKHTAMSSATTNDPIEAANELVTLANRGLVTQPEPEQIPQDETHGETGEEAAAEEAELRLVSADPNDGLDAEPATGFDAGDDTGQQWGDGDRGERRDHSQELDAASVGPDVDVGTEPDAVSGHILDADYTLPEIELIPPEPDPDFGAELLEFEGELAAEPEPEASGAFIFGDNLHQMRTAAIGLVVQAALQRLPANIDYARLSELRNFAMGVAEGRWPDDPVRQAELQEAEAEDRLRRNVEIARDAKVDFLLTASREQIEAFDATADWP